MRKLKLKIKNKQKYLKRKQNYFKQKALMGCACARSQTPNDTKSDIK